MAYEKPSITTVGSVAELTLGDRRWPKGPKGPKAPRGGVS